MTAILPPGPRGPLISVEGISGAGKTYLTHRLARDPGITTIEAFSERARAGPGTLGGQLLRALITAAHGEHFLRAGHPGTETVLLLAVKTFDFEQCLPLLMRGEAIIEGRSMDSIAVYQSLITCPDDLDRAHAEARAILTIAAQWRPLPDLTILLTDDVPTAIGRAEKRDSRRFTAEQVSIHHQADTLFRLLAADHPDRFQVIDRRTTGIRQTQAQCAAWITGLRYRMEADVAAG
jgi:dTMP kinase